MKCRYCGAQLEGKGRVCEGCRKAAGWEPGDTPAYEVRYDDTPWAPVDEDTSAAIYDRYGEMDLIIIPTVHPDPPGGAGPTLVTLEVRRVR